MLGAVFVGLPPVMGSMAESKLPQLIEKVSSNPNASAEVVSFERGYWASKAVSRWTIEASGGEKLELMVDHEIDQMPSLDGLVTVRSVPRVPAEAKEDIDYFFEGRDPVIAVSHAGLSGIDTLITSPSFDRPAKDDANTKVTWRGATVEISMDSAATAGSMRLDAPGLRVEEPGLALEFDSLTSEGTFDEVAGVPITPKMEAKLASISMGEMSLKGITWHQEERQNGDLFDVDASITVDGIDASGQSYTNARYDFSARNIDARALYAFMEQMQAMSSESDPQQVQAQSGAAAFDMFGKLLKASPVLAMKAFHIDGPDGPIDAALETSFDGAAGPVALDNIPGLINRTKVKGNLQVPKGLAQKLANQFAAQRARMIVMGAEPEAEPTQEQIAQLAEAQQQMSEQILGQLLASNIAVEEGERYKTAFAMADGHFEVNGSNADHLLGPLLMQ